MCYNMCSLNKDKDGEKKIVCIYQIHILKTSPKWET